MAAEVLSQEEEKAETLQAAQLKSMGNEAYSRGDVEAAVGFWNQAIRQHVEGMKTGEGPSCLSQESRDLERSIYLNLAQGYLKLKDGAKALRACQVVMHEHPEDPKARFRTAEACLLLKRYEEAEKILKVLLEAEPPLPEAVKLKQRIQAAKRLEVAERKKVAQKMSAGIAGLSDEKPSPVETGYEHLPRPAFADLDTVSANTDIADAAAKAARKREQRLAAAQNESPLPVPAVNDLESFMAKAMGRSQKYKAAMAQSRKQRENAQRSVRLDWLRSGREGSAMDEFVSPLQEELRKIEADDAKAVEDEDQETEDNAKKDEEPVAAGVMQEMD